MATNLKFKQETAQLSMVQFHMIKQKKKILHSWHQKSHVSSSSSSTFPPNQKGHTITKPEQKALTFLQDFQQFPSSWVQPKPRSNTYSSSSSPTWHAEPTPQKNDLTSHNLKMVLWSRLETSPLDHPSSLSPPFLLYLLNTHQPFFHPFPSRFPFLQQNHPDYTPLHLPNNKSFINCSP